MDIIEKIKQILFDSEKFFSNLNKEKSVEEALKFYAILAAFSAVMSFIIVLLFGDKFTNLILNMLRINQPVPQLTTLKLFGQVVMGYIFVVIGSFVATAILYVWLLIFKGNKGYAKAYQLYIYSSTPGLLINWIPFASVITWIYSFVLLVIGTKKIYNFSNTKAVLIYLIPLIIIFIIGVIFLAAAIAFLSARGSLA